MSRCIAKESQPPRVRIRPRIRRDDGFDHRLLAPLISGAVLNPINSTIIAVALVPIGMALGAPASTTAWLISSLYLATAVGQPVVGRLIDMYGPRRLFLPATALVGLAGVAGTFAPNLTLEDGRIDWGQTSDVVFAQVRGVTPEPGAFTTIDGARLKIGEAAIAWDVPALNAGAIEERGGHVLVGTISNPLRLIRVQPAGKTMMDARDWWRGVSASALQADFGGWAS